MKELTEDQKNYIISNRFWKAAQDNLIEGLEINFENSSKMVETHTKAKQLAEDQLVHEYKFRENGWKAYLEYCEVNGIDPDVEIPLLK